MKNYNQIHLDPDIADDEDEPAVHRCHCST
jgi:hypothetical protein